MTSRRNKISLNDLGNHIMGTIGQACERYDQRRLWEMPAQAIRCPQVLDREGFPWKSIETSMYIIDLLTNGLDYGIFRPSLLRVHSENTIPYQHLVLYKSLEGTMEVLGFCYCPEKTEEPSTYKGPRPKSSRTIIHLTRILDEDGFIVNEERDGVLQGNRGAFSSLRDYLIETLGEFEFSFSMISPSDMVHVKSFLEKRNDDPETFNLWKLNRHIGEGKKLEDPDSNHLFRRVIL